MMNCWRQLVAHGLPLRYQELWYCTGGAQIYLCNDYAIFKYPMDWGREREGDVITKDSSLPQKIWRRGGAEGTQCHSREWAQGEVAPVRAWPLQAVHLEGHQRQQCCQSHPFVFASVYCHLHEDVDTVILVSAWGRYSNWWEADKTEECCEQHLQMLVEDGNEVKWHEAEMTGQHIKQSLPFNLAWWSPWPSATILPLGLCTQHERWMSVQFMTVSLSCPFPFMLYQYIHWLTSFSTESCTNRFLQQSELYVHLCSWMLNWKLYIFFITGPQLN